MPDERLPLVEMANQALLDRLAWRASKALSGAGVPHALIKGVTTARWLYDPPRIYRDVDILLPSGSLPVAVKTLAAEQVAQPRAGRLGEEASHSLVMIAADGRELDLHVTLPTLPTPSPRESAVLWSGFAEHLVEFPLEEGPVPALDLVGRTIVLAMHFLGSHDSVRCREDLQRAVAHLDTSGLTAVLTRADRIGIGLDVRTALRIAEGGVSAAEATAPLQLRLRLAGAHSPAIRLASILQQPRRTVVSALWREVFPSRDVLLRQHAGATGRDLPRLYVRRWRWAAGAMRTAVTELRRSVRRTRVRPGGDAR